jgi:hypothetical protein
VQAFGDAEPATLDSFNNRRKRVRMRQFRQEGFLMKSKMTLGLAAAMLTLTLSALARPAAASSTTAAPEATSELVRKAGGDKVKYMEVGLAVDTLLSVLLP